MHIILFTIVCDSLINVVPLFVDIDECATNKGGCQKDCKNLNGTYECSCLDGYVLDTDDKRTCSTQTIETNTGRIV